MDPHSLSRVSDLRLQPFRRVRRACPNSYRGHMLSRPSPKIGSKVQSANSWPWTEIGVWRQVSYGNSGVRLVKKGGHSGVPGGVVFGFRFTRD